MTIHIITLGFAPAQMIRKSWKSLYSSGDTSYLTSHWFLNQHYPLNQMEDEAALKELCGEYLVTWLDSGKDLGLHNGFNFCVDVIKPEPNDVLVMYDPDSQVIEGGWLNAIETVLSDPTIGWCTVMNPRAKEQIQRHEEITVHGCRAWLVDYPTVSSVSGFKASFLKAAGGLKEPRAYYGHLEAAMLEELKKQNLQWAFLPDFNEDEELRSQHDREYLEYKWTHSILNEWPGNFESFLKAGRPMSKPCPEMIP